MDKTPEEILKSNLKMFELFPVASKEDKEMGMYYITSAMKEYAEQEAKSYAAWLSNQVIAGRTMTKLWDDYQKELNT